MVRLKEGLIRWRRISRTNEIMTDDLYDTERAPGASRRGRADTHFIISRLEVIANEPFIQLLLAT